MKGSTRAKRARYSPVQVYVNDDTLAMWGAVDEAVKAAQRTNPKYSISQFVNDAVRAKLAAK